MKFKKEIGSTLIYDDNVLFDGKGNYIFGDKRERERENREIDALEKEMEEAGGIQYKEDFLKEIENDK